jgi:general nucleoside transport system permease protein
MDNIIINGMAFSMPLFIIAVGGIYSESSGITNLALEGLLGFGAFCGGLTVAVIEHLFPAGSALPMYIALFAATAGGAAYAVLHGVLCITFKANQVISGVVINILSLALTAFLANQINTAVFGKTSNKFLLAVSPRIDIPVVSKIPLAGAFFTSVYPFEFIIIVVAVMAWYVLYKTPAGLRIRACGDNPHAVDAAGGNVAAIRYGAVITSGALSGLGGICFAYSISSNFSPSIFMGFGYLSIAAFIFGNWKILPTLATCLLFGFARSGGYALVTKLELPGSYSDLVLTMPYVLTLVLLIFFSKTNHPPRALGEIYDKGKR